MPAATRGWGERTRSRVGTFPTGTEERRLWGRKVYRCQSHLPNPLQQGWQLPGGLAELLGLGVEGCLPTWSRLLLGARGPFPWPWSWWSPVLLSLPLDLASTLITSYSEDIFPYSEDIFLTVPEGHGLPEHQRGWDPRKDTGPPATLPEPHASPPLPGSPSLYHPLLQEVFLDTQRRTALFRAPEHPLDTSLPCPVAKRLPLSLSWLLHSSSPQPRRASMEE